jgi:polyisoprenoid-binding protein YceI
MNSSLGNGTNPVYDEKQIELESKSTDTWNLEQQRQASGGCHLMKKNLNVLIFALMFGATAGATVYQLDPAHGEVGFVAKHLMVSKVRGRFAKFEGTFNFDEKKNEVTNINIKIDPSSIDTANAKRDDHLRSPDFFDVKKEKDMIFKADKVVVKKDTPVKVNGTLTMHGITKPLTLDLTYNGSMIDPWGNPRVGYSISGKLNRKDWGLNWNKALDKGGVTVSDEIALEIEGEASAPTKK